MNARAVKAKAAELGFGPIGIASTEPFDADLERTLEWIGKGMQAEMAWITPERTQRACQPDDLLPGAWSLIVVGVPYGGRDPEPPDDRARGHVARYARGQDYHDV